MAINKIQNVSCSLNLGLIYQLSYSYAPRDGVKISIYFANETGVYNTNNILSTANKQQIKIGNAMFNLFPTFLRKELAQGRKVVKVDFEDETFQLENYFIALTGRGCGTGVYQLGQTVDTRTDAQKAAEDPDLFTILKFTSFEDVEYSFTDFITTLKKKFPVQILSAYDNTITRDFTGTFKSVLDSWCSYFNFTYFFENSILKIVSPSDLQINLPDAPANALDYSFEETLKNTFNKTAWNYFADEGGEQILDQGDNALVANMPVRPYENILDIKNLNGQVQVDINQVIAAQYGQEFWFLYNYKKGTAGDICGWRNVNTVSDIQVTQAIKGNLKLAFNSNAEIAVLDQNVFDNNYEFYKEYGQKIAGRVYISNGLGDLEFYNDFSFYDQGNGQIFNLDVLRTRPQVSLTKFRVPSGRTTATIEETKINDVFQGVVCNGNRLYFIDDFVRNFNVFNISENLKSKIQNYYNLLTNGLFGNEGFDYGNNILLIAYYQQSLDSDIISLINNVPNNKNLFAYRQQIFNLKGVAPIKKITEDFNPLNEAKITILNNTNGISSNVSTIKAIVDSDLLVYYAKYEDCKSASSNEPNLYSRKFEDRRISDDIPISIRPSRKSQGVIEITRDFSYFEQYSKSEILSKLSQPFTINQKTVQFSLNYFYEDIPTSFISNGLVGMDISVGSDGISASYSYSNEVLNVPVSEADLFKIERSIKNSWINTYKPRTTLKV